MIQRWMGIAFLASALAACGADDGSGGGAGSGGNGGDGGSGGTGLPAPICDEGFTACGGDPVGVWTFDQACGEVHRPLDLAQPDPCQDLPSRWTTVLEGTLDFREDGSLVEDYEGEQTLAFDLPVACLEALEPALPRETCIATGRAIVDREDGFGGCVWGAGDVCACEITVAASFARTRAWDVQAGTLTIDGTITYELCVGEAHLVRRQDDGADGHLVDVLVRAD